MQLYFRRSTGRSSGQGYLVCVPRRSAEGNSDLEVLLDMHRFEGENNIISSNIADEFRRDGVEVIIYLRLTGLNGENRLPPDCEYVLENLKKQGIDYRSGRKRLLFHNGETRYICELGNGQQVNTEARETVVSSQEWESDKSRMDLTKKITTYIAMRRKQMEAYDIRQEMPNEQCRGRISSKPSPDKSKTRGRSRVG